MARADPQLNFRIPADLKTRLEAAARADGRSLNQELIRRLEASFDAAPASPDEDFTLRVALEVNESRLEALRAQGYTLEMHREVLAQRLDVLKTAKRSISDVRDVEQKLAAAESELKHLYGRRTELLEENHRLLDRQSAATMPLRKQIMKTAELRMQQELDEAERQESERVAALVALQPTSEELQRVGEILAERQRQRSEEILGGRRRSPPGRAAVANRDAPAARRPAKKKAR